MLTGKVRRWFTEKTVLQQESSQAHGLLTVITLVHIKCVQSFRTTHYGIKINQINQMAWMNPFWNVKTSRGRSGIIGNNAEVLNPVPNVKHEEQKILGETKKRKLLPLWEPEMCLKHFCQPPPVNLLFEFNLPQMTLILRERLRKTLLAFYIFD